MPRRSKEKKISVVDAGALIADVEQHIAWGKDAGPQSKNLWRTSSVADHVIKQWRDSPVVLRVDDEFAGALLNSDTDVEMVTDWLDRQPFGAFGVTLTQPLALHDGEALCRYSGFIVCGITRRQISEERARTTYLPLSPRADGVRIVWIYRWDGERRPLVQEVSFDVRGVGHNKGHTLADVIAVKRMGAEDRGQSTAEFEALYALSLQLLLYLASTEPEVDWLPAERLARPQQLTGVRVGNVGWRVGVELRNYRSRATAGLEQRHGGWRLPPHIRKAHWTRVRMAMRDEQGNIVGDRLGERDVDWYYELRWIKPVPVNVGEDGPAPAVRKLG